MTPEDCDELIDTVRSVFPAALHNADPDTVVAAYMLAIGDLDYRDCAEQIGVLVRTGQGPFITPGKDIRLPLLRRLGCLAPSALEAWETVARYVKDATEMQLMPQDLHPLLRAAFESETFQAQVVHSPDGLRLRDKTWSRKAFEEVYELLSDRYDEAVLIGDTAAAVAAAKAEPPRELLATDWRAVEEAADQAAVEAEKRRGIDGPEAA